MRFYIAYKYRGIEDKEGLKHDLDAISNTIKSLGHETFVLGRDVQRWGKNSYSSVINTIPAILENLNKSDILFAFINSNTRSWGLTFELICAKLKRKSIYYAVREGIKCRVSKDNSHIIHYSDINDLTNKIKEINL